jgi:serine/threonine protein kinase/WD40 repeat protein/tetratricopeptide (TPR) repeat protein
MGRVPEQALRWALERVSPDRDLCDVLFEAGWLDAALMEQVRRETLREESDRSPTLPDQGAPSLDRHETEPLGLGELPPGAPAPHQGEQDLSGWPLDEAPGPADRDPEAGPLLLGPYRILRKLGQGGMGMVFLAEHTVLRRQIALKLIRPREGADRRRALRRFEIEARAMARLEHPNILKILDIRVEAEQAYMVMELARGGTLSERINSPEGQAGIEEVVTWIEGLARALHHAHEHAIIHRDVKPDNVLFDSAGSPLLTDFGLAKALDEDNAGISTPGAMIGTLLYMSPEQIHGRQLVDARTDVYALGATFYEALTGLPPFMANSAHDLIEKVLNKRAPSPRKTRAEVPADVETIVARCLAKERDERYQTALALAEDCQRFRERRPILARPTSVPERLRLWVRRNPLGAVATLVAGLSLLVSPAVLDAVEQRSLAQSAIETAEAVRAANEELEAQETKARAAEAAALEAKARAQASLARATYLQAQLEAKAGYRRRALQLYGESARQLRALERDPFAAEAGRWDLWRRSPQGLLSYPGVDPVRRLAIRGERVWIGRAEKLEIWDATRAVLLERLEVPKGEVLSSLALSPDGKRGLGGGSRGSLWLWTLGDPAPRVLSRAGAGVSAVAIRSQGDYALSVDATHLVRLRQLESDLEILIPIRDQVTALCFVPGTKRFMVGLRDEVQIWDAQTQRRTATLKIPGELLSAHSKQGLAGGPGVVHLLDPLAGATRHRFELDPRPLRSLALGEAGGLAVDSQGVAHELDTRTLRVRRRWELVSDRVRLAACDAAGRRLVTSEPIDSSPGRLARLVPPRLWRCAPSRHQRQWRAPRRRRTSLVRTQQGLIASGCVSGLIELWDPELELLVGRWRQESAVLALATHGEHVASGGQDGQVRVWRLGEQEPFLTLGPHLGPIRALAFSPGGQRLLVGGEGIPLRALDLPPDDPARQILEGYPVGPQAEATLAPSGRLQVRGPSPATFDAQPLRLWDLESARPIESYVTGRVGSVGWSGTTPVSGGQAGRFCAWNQDSKTPTWQVSLPPPSEGVSPAVQALLRRDSSWVLAAGSALWVAPAGGGAAHRLEPPSESLGAARALAPGPSASTVWSGHADGQVALWDLESGRALLVAPGHRNEVTALQVLPGGRLLSVSLDGLILVRDFRRGAPRTGVEEALAAEGRRRATSGRAAPWPEDLVQRVAAANGAWDLAPAAGNNAAEADRRAAARARGAWPELQALVPRAPGVRGRLQSAALETAIRLDQAVGEVDELLRVGKADEADFRRLLLVLSELAASVPGDERVHLQLGRMAEATSREKIAARSYRTALEIDPDLAPGKLTPGLLVARGRWHLDGGRDAAALIDYRRLGESRHRVAGRPSRLYAQLLLALDDPERALAALGQDQRSADRRLRCRAFLELGRPEEALDALDPQDTKVETALLRARVLRRLGRLPEAQRLLQAIVELEARVDVRLRTPTAFRYYEADLERYVRDPDFVAVRVGYGAERLGARHLVVRYRVTASSSIQIVDRDFSSRSERRPAHVALEARLELARLLCGASRQQPKERRELLEAAVQELSKAVRGGLREFEEFHSDPDLVLIRQLKSYQDLLRRERR